MPGRVRSLRHRLEVLAQPALRRPVAFERRRLACRAPVPCQQGSQRQAFAIQPRAPPRGSPALPQKDGLRTDVIEAGRAAMVSGRREGRSNRLLMAKPRNRNSTDLDRRKLLRACVRGAAAGIAGLGLSARRAVAEDAMLRALTQQNQGGHLDSGFASVSRAMPMPDPSLPTLSPATVQATEAAIGRYEAI